MQPGFNGSVGVLVSSSSSDDLQYDGLTNAELSVYVEDRTLPEVLVRSSTSEMHEGSLVTYEVALSTVPSSDVNLAIHLVWVSGLPFDMTVTPQVVVFPAGQQTTYQTVSLELPYDPSFLGDSAVEIKHTAISDDPYYDSLSGTGIAGKALPITVHDIDRVGVCLARCTGITRYDIVFTRGEEDGIVDTPYEVVTGEVRRFQWPSLKTLMSLRSMHVKPELACRGSWSSLSLLHVFSVHSS